MPSFDYAAPTSISEAVTLMSSGGTVRALAGGTDLIDQLKMDRRNADLVVDLHLVAAISNGLILEYYRDTVNPMHGKVWEHELEFKDGKVHAPDRPGLGLEPKWDTLEEFRVG